MHVCTSVCRIPTNPQGHEWYVQSTDKHVNRSYIADWLTGLAGWLAAFLGIAKSSLSGFTTFFSVCIRTLILFISTSQSTDRQVGLTVGK